MAFPLLDCYSI